MTTCSYCNKSSCCGPMQREWTHFSLPWGSRVETCSEVILASRQTEMTTWLLRPDGFLPQIHSPGLTEWQPHMSQLWRWLWDVKNILGTHAVTWTPGRSAFPWSPPRPKQAGPSRGTAWTPTPTPGIKDQVQSSKWPSGFLTLRVKN